MPRCHVCGVDELMAYKCTYCGRAHCGEHRLPESHLCPEIDLAAEARLSRERLGASGVRTPLKVTVQGPARAAGIWQRVEGRLAIGLLVAMGVVYILELIVGLPPRNAPPSPAFRAAFVFDANWYTKPWVLITSTLAHGDFLHITVNGVVMFMFGPLLERRVGSRNFAVLFLGGGIAAAFGEIYIMEAILGQASGGVLGASGGLMAISGALAMLAPGLRVLVFFVIPMPMWGMVLLYAFIDFARLGTGDSVAHMAHLAGLVVGLAVGHRWRDQGMRFPGEMGQWRAPWSK